MVLAFRPLSFFVGWHGKFWERKRNSFPRNFCIDTEIFFLHISRKIIAGFVIFSENMLDNLGKWCYIIQARVRYHYARTAMMREIASKDGNFRGVCPVIGRLNCFGSVCVYRCAEKKGSGWVGHFLWRGVIRSAARTRNSSTVPRHYAN